MVKNKKCERNRDYYRCTKCSTELQRPYLSYGVREKKALLALYNAMNETDYENEDDLKVTTLESALYLEMKNDVSFVLYDELLLYEHQSTKNPNLPLRNLFYVSDVYSELTKDLFLYGSVPVQIPERNLWCFTMVWKICRKRSLKTVQLICEESGTHKPGTGNISIKCKCRL